MAHGGGGVTLLCTSYCQSLVRVKFRVTCDVSVIEVSRVPVLTQADLMMKREALLRYKRPDWITADLMNGNWPFLKIREARSPCDLLRHSSR